MYNPCQKRFAGKDMHNLNNSNCVKPDLNLDSIKTSLGEEKAWDMLSLMNPDEICRNALVSYDSSRGLYTLKSFGTDFQVFPATRKVAGSSSLGSKLLSIREYFFELSIIWYLVSAKNIPLSGKWVKPVDVKGGQIFFMGTHKLPLDELAEKYSHDTKGFLIKAGELGGTVCSYADACIILYPFPMVPVKLLLWLEDEEFPPRVDLMLDSTCDSHLPTDVIWSVTTTTTLLMF
jgi:hypothetical protein